jgi:hypothetical protein
MFILAQELSRTQTPVVFGLLPLPRARSPNEGDGAWQSSALMAAYGLPLYNPCKEPLLPIVVTHIAHLGHFITNIQISKMHSDYPLVNCEVG